MKLAIISAGLGTRVQERLGTLPKCLLSVAGTSALLRQYRWAMSTAQFDEIAVVTHTPQAVLDFALLNGLAIKVIEHKWANGSANAIRSLPSNWQGEQVVLHWSDILCTSPGIGLERPGNFAVTDPGRGRYIVSDGAIVRVKEGQGDVCGIYKVQSFRIPQYGYGMGPTPKDFADVANDFVHGLGLWEALPCDELVHFGDMASLQEAEALLNFESSNKPTAVHFQDEYAYKQNRGLEMHWFDLASSRGIKHLAISGNRQGELKMYRAEGTVHDKPHLLPAADLLQRRIANRMQTLHTMPIEPKLTIGRVQRRNTNADDIAVAKYLCELLPESDTATQGHFDLHFHNIVYIGDEVYPIDPGGDTFVGAQLGPLGYELGKMLYGYYFWSPTYAWFGPCFLYEQLEVKVPDWLLNNKHARIWACLHALSATNYFKHDYTRHLWCQDGIQRMVRELTEGL